MIPVTVTSISLSNVGFVVILKSRQDERSLPIFIGVPEAQAIAMELNGAKPARPLTHDLVKNVLDVLEGRLDHVEVHDLKDGTFFGRLVLSFEGQRLEVDSRPSDAIAVALRCKAPVLVAQQVMDEAGVVLDSKEKPATEPLRPGPDTATRLKEELARAVAEERYEDAAKLRDQISRTTSAN